jgi:hypothetical protein
MNFDRIILNSQCNEARLLSLIILEDVIKVNLYIFFRINGIQYIKVNKILFNHLCLMLLTY